MNAATGSTCDVSTFLRFYFWQPIYFNSDDSSFLSKPAEQIGRFVGISENVGHDVTFSILKKLLIKLLVGLMPVYQVILFPLTLGWTL